MESINKEISIKEILKIKEEKLNSKPNKMCENEFTT